MFRMSILDEAHDPHDLVSPIGSNWTIQTPAGRLDGQKCLTPEIKRWQLGNCGGQKSYCCCWWWWFLSFLWGLGKISKHLDCGLVTTCAPCSAERDAFKMIDMFFDPALFNPKSLYKV